MFVSRKIWILTRNSIFFSTSETSVSYEFLANCVKCMNINMVLFIPCCIIDTYTHTPNMWSSNTVSTRLRCLYIQHKAQCVFNQHTWCFCETSLAAACICNAWMNLMLTFHAQANELLIVLHTFLIADDAVKWHGLNMVLVLHFTWHPMCFVLHLGGSSRNEKIVL